MSRRHETLNGLALIFLSVAPIFFVAFHFLPFERGDRYRGWRFWVEIAAIAKHPELIGIDSGKLVIALTAFLMIPLLLLASPFLMPVYKSSKVFHGLALALALMSTVGFTGLALAQWDPHSRPGSGIVCLMVAQVFNLIGLALVRTGKPRKGEIPPPQ